MQHEIETAQKDLGVAEEKVLERMLEADELAAQVKKAETERAATKEGHRGREGADGRGTDRGGTGAGGGLGGARRAGRDDGGPTLALFEQVSRARKGVAICQATRDGMCSQCQVRLRPMVFQQVRANDTIVQCDSCRRILYYVPPPPLATPPVTHAP